MDTTRVPIGHILLGVVAATSVIALVAILPGLGLVLKQFGVAKRLSNRQYVSNALSRLQRKGLIIFEGEGSSRRVRITHAGRVYLQSKRSTLLHRPKKRRWDGYWRVVIFDIPERIKKVRDSLRKELRAVGFKKIQASVWVSPDECEEYLKLLKADRRLGKFLIYIKTKDIEYSSTLARSFQIEVS